MSTHPPVPQLSQGSPPGTTPRDHPEASRPPPGPSAPPENLHRQSPKHLPRHQSWRTLPARCRRPGRWTPLQGTRAAAQQGGRGSGAARVRQAASQAGGETRHTGRQAAPRPPLHPPHQSFRAMPGPTHVPLAAAQPAKATHLHASQPHPAHSCPARCPPAGPAGRRSRLGQPPASEAAAPPPGGAPVSCSLPPSRPSR